MVTAPTSALTVDWAGNEAANQVNQLGRQPSKRQADQVAELSKRADHYGQVGGFRNGIHLGS